MKYILRLKFKETKSSQGMSVVTTLGTSIPNNIFLLYRQKSKELFCICKYISKVASVSTNTLPSLSNLVFFIKVLPRVVLISYRSLTPMEPP